MSCSVVAEAAAPTCLEFAEYSIERAGQFVRRPIDRQGYRRSLVADRHGLPPGKARFHHAALVPAAVLGAVQVTQVNLDARDVLRKTLKCGAHVAFNFDSEPLRARYVVIGVELNLHAGLARVVSVSHGHDSSLLHPFVSPGGDPAEHHMHEDAQPPARHRN